jgi:hypothetical protein
LLLRKLLAIKTTLGSEIYKHIEQMRESSKKHKVGGPARTRTGDQQVSQRPQHL